MRDVPGLAKGSAGREHTKFNAETVVSTVVTETAFLPRRLVTVELGCQCGAAK